MQKKLFHLLIYAILLFTLTTVGKTIFLSSTSVSVE